MTDQNTSGSYVVYNYGAIEWPEDAGESTCSAGYKMGGEIWYTIPGSQVEDAVTITNTTNINEPGIWFFKVDKPETCKRIRTVENIAARVIFQTSFKLMVESI